MKLFSILFAAFVCAGPCAAQEAPEQNDSAPGLVVLKSKRERRMEQQDVRNTSTDPDALNNTGMMPTSASPSPRYIYEYSVEIRNDSPKKIRWLSWVYLLSDPDSKQELDRQEFVSFEKVSPGQKKTLRGRRRFSLISVENRKKKNSSPLKERVEFNCVAYEDGMVWHRPFMSEALCAETQKRGKSR